MMLIFTGGVIAARAGREKYYPKGWRFFLHRQSAPLRHSSPHCVTLLSVLSNNWMLEEEVIVK
jgi:hypothetical protein